MKFGTLVLVVMNLSIQAVYAAEKAPSNAKTYLPSVLLALQADESYAIALKHASTEVAAAAASSNCYAPSIDPTSLIIVGFEASDNFRDYFGGREVSIFLGAPTRRWPSSVINVGRIHARANIFPDGVEGFRIPGDASFELSCNKTPAVQH